MRNRLKPYHVILCVMHGNDYDYVAHTDSYKHAFNKGYKAMEDKGVLGFKVYRNWMPCRVIEHD